MAVIPWVTVFVGAVSDNMADLANMTLIGYGYLLVSCALVYTITYLFTKSDFLDKMHLLSWLEPMIWLVVLLLDGHCFYHAMPDRNRLARVGRKRKTQFPLVHTYCLK